MRLAIVPLLACLLPCQAAGVNPLLPSYPWKSAHITYKKTPMFEGEAWVAGGRAWMSVTRMLGGRPQRTETTWSDGAWVWRAETRGETREVTRRRHLGAFLRGDAAALDPEGAQKLAAGLPGHWNLYSPVFGVEWIGEDAKVTPLPETTVAGKPCDAYQVALGPMTLTYSRWKGTDVILKVEARGQSLEAEKVEVDADVPLGLFEPPKDLREPDASVEMMDRDLAKKAWKRLTGRDAVADPGPASAGGAPGAPGPVTFTFDKETLTFPRLTFTWTGKDAAGDENGVLTLGGEAGGWSLQVQAAFPCQDVSELVGKTGTVSAEDATIAKGDVVYVSKRLKCTVVAAAPAAVSLKLTGKWVRRETRADGEFEREVRAADVACTASGG